MAAFPLPTLHLQIPEPLDGLFIVSTVSWLNANGTKRFTCDPDLERIRECLADRDRYAPALRQLEVLLAVIRDHRGPVAVEGADATFDKLWQTPHDCLTYFADWRRAISEAIRGMDDPPFFNPAWMTETVVALRDAILAEKAFDRLPILADALEDAGCDNRFVLDHLRGDDDHTHMCWVLDLLSVG